MNPETQERRDYGFVAGLLSGTLVGAGLAIWLAPRLASELRARVASAVDDLARRGQDVRDDVAETVARGAHEVERRAIAAKSARTSEARTHPA